MAVPMTRDKNLSPAGREELALALLLWKDFKSQGQMNVEISMQCHQLAVYLGVETELDILMPKLPPMKIEPRWKAKPPDFQG